MTKNISDILERFDKQFPLRTFGRYSLLHPDCRLYPDYLKQFIAIEIKELLEGIVVKKLEEEQTWHEFTVGFNACHWQYKKKIEEAKK